MSDLTKKARALADGATKGPWEWWTSNSFHRLSGADGRDGGVLCAHVHCDGQPSIYASEPNLAFIASSRELVPALCDEVDAALDKVRVLEGQIEALGDVNEAHVRIERDTAEAIARWVDGDGTSTQCSMLASDIRSGSWRRKEK